MFTSFLQVLMGLMKPLELLVRELNAYLSKRRVDKEIKPLMDLQVKDEVSDMDVINAARELHKLKKD